MKNAVVLLLMMLMIVYAIPISAAQGKVVLCNGHTLIGDINRLQDGGCWLIMKKGSLKIEKDEIKSIVIYSRRDPVSERFVNSFRNTPAHAVAPRASSTPYDNIIHREAKKNNLDPALVKAVIKAESNFNPNDISCKGARGLMQLMPETASMLGVKSIYSPEENIKGGTRFLRDMLEQFNGDEEKAIAAYNAGPGAVKKYRQIPPYRETRMYVNNVKRYYRRYKGGGGLCTFIDDTGCLNIYNVR